MKKVITSTVLLLILGIGVFFLRNNFDTHQIQQSAKQVLSERNDRKTGSTQTTSGQPVRLRIPAIGVDAFAESVGLDSQGNMDIPKKDEDVAWYNLGYKLGENGSTVLAGHYDTRTGAPAVFFKLADVQMGDTVTVIDEHDQQFTFAVVSTETYPYDKFPLQEVFGPYQENRLVLITCEGNYNSQTRNYSHRTVVFAKKSAD